MILLSTISKMEKDILLNSLETLLDRNVIYKLINKKYEQIKSSKNFYADLRILLTIFINTYELELKKGTKHLFEKTGTFFINLEKYFLFNH